MSRIVLCQGSCIYKKEPKKYQRADRKHLTVGCLLENTISFLNDHIIGSGSHQASEKNRTGKIKEIILHSPYYRICGHDVME
jgi:hypothetical protein